MCFFFEIAWEVKCVFFPGNDLGRTFGAHRCLSSYGSKSRPKKMVVVCKKLEEPGGGLEPKGKG